MPSSEYKVEAPPSPKNYKFEQTLTYQGDSGFGFDDLKHRYDGVLSCTKCNEVLRSNVSHDNLEKALFRVDRHNSEKHPDLLYVLTSVGWMQAGQLIPDPVKQINDAIDASAKQSFSAHPNFLHD